MFLQEYIMLYSGTSDIHMSVRSEAIDWSSDTSGVWEFLEPAYRLSNNEFCLFEVDTFSYTLNNNIGLFYTHAIIVKPRVYSNLAVASRFHST